MNWVTKILYLISSLLTKKRLIKIVDKYNHRFVVFSHKKKVVDELSSENNMFALYVGLKERKKFLGIPYWSTYIIASFLGSENSYQNTILNNGLEGKFIYNKGENNMPTFIFKDKDDYDLAIENTLKYKISRQLGFSPSDGMDQEKADKINSYYKSYTRESRLSSLLDN